MITPPLLPADIIFLFSALLAHFGCTTRSYPSDSFPHSGNGCLGGCALKIMPSSQPGHSKGCLLPCRHSISPHGPSLAADFDSGVAGSSVCFCPSETLLLRESVWDSKRSHSRTLRWLDGFEAHSTFVAPFLPQPFGTSLCFRPFFWQRLTPWLAVRRE